MTKEEFLKTYYFTFLIVKQDNTTLAVTTGVIDRKSMKVVDTIKTTIDILSTNEWIKDNQSEISLTEWDWTTYIDQVKRFQLDYFAKRIGIEGYAPLNITENGDIGGMYK
jgi:hypothetical protein